MVFVYLTNASESPISHQETIKSVAEILAAAGLSSTKKLTRKHIFRRVSQTQINHYQDIYPSIEIG